MINYTLTSLFVVGTLCLIIRHYNIYFLLSEVERKAVSDGIESPLLAFYVQLIVRHFYALENQN